MRDTDAKVVCAAMLTIGLVTLAAPGMALEARGDLVAIAQDIRKRLGVRRTFLRNLRRADFFPGDLRPRVGAVISATEWQVQVYGQAIASLESGQGLSVGIQEEMRIADDEKNAAVGLLRADLGLPSAPAGVDGGIGLEADEPPDLAENLAALAGWALIGLVGLGLLRIGLRRRLRTRAS